MTQQTVGEPIAVEASCLLCSGAGGHYVHREGHPILGPGYSWSTWSNCTCRLEAQFGRLYPFIPLPMPRVGVTMPTQSIYWVGDFTRWQTELGKYLWRGMLDTSPPRLATDEALTRAFVTEGQGSGGVQSIMSYSGLVIVTLGVAVGNSATPAAVVAAISARGSLPLWVYSPSPLSKLPGKGDWKVLEPSLHRFQARQV
jgi:hypothetical protein